MKNFRMFNGYKQYRGNSGWQFTHRTVAARKIGSPVPDGYQVHHRNGIKTDNRPSNISVVPASVHRKIHNKK